MGSLLHLALAHAIWNRWKSLLLVMVLTVVLAAPLATRSVASALEASWERRADQFPLVLGARGSRVDLVLHALFHTRQPDTTARMGDVEEAQRAGHAPVVPLYIRHSAAGFPVVGTTPAYFDHRGLSIEAGRPLMILGECLLGAEVARRLSLGPGDRLASDAENVFDLDAGEPLLMRVAGVLSPTRSPDDRAVFVDMRTAWIISGIGHGHDEPGDIDDEDAILSREEGYVLGGALSTHREITPENAHTFHFHGEPGDMPVTAFLAFPADERGRTLLRGRFQSARQPVQALLPGEVIEEVLSVVFRVRRLVDALLMVGGGAMMLLLSLVLLLSLKLRRREFHVLHALGMSRRRISLLIALEWVLYFIPALGLAAAIALAARLAAPFVTATFLSG